MRRSLIPIPIPILILILILILIVRAVSSIALNIAEAQYSDPGNRRARFHTAAGSANETRAALRVAIAWGYFAEADAKPAAVLLERIVPTLWKLARG